MEQPSDGQREDGPFGRSPGVCVPWEAKLAEVGQAKGDVELVRQEWERLETSVYLYLWSWIA